MTDAELRADIEAGLSTSQIAHKHGISRQAVNKRRQRLQTEVTTLAVVAQPESRRLVSSELDAMELLNTLMGRLMMLLDAHHELLLDPDDPNRYDIGPRSTEIEVMYYEPGEERTRKAPLQELLDRIDNRFDPQSLKWRAADPRTEIRATAAAISSLVSQMVELAAMLADARAMQTLREELLAEIAQVDADVAQRIAVALRRRLILCSAR